MVRGDDSDSPIGESERVSCALDASWKQRVKEGLEWLRAALIACTVRLFLAALEGDFTVRR